MAPLKPVRSLYDFSLDEVLKVIKEYISKTPKNLLPFRQQLIGMLHGAIREQLIDRAVSSHSLNVIDLLDILELLADSTTKKLQLKKNGEFLTGLQSSQLYSKIDGANIIGLNELHVKVQVEHSSPSQIGLPSGCLLHKALRRGLASNLRVLTLHNAADNQLLKIIGQYAQHLTNLDITSSWLVDDVGIGDLLLKDASHVIKDHVGGSEVCCEPGTIEALASLPKSQINRTCETLQEVRIQDTNTSSISVLLLLMFSTNLKSLGGFLYYRNIGDAVLSVQMREGAPAHLPLSELWDSHLPLDKLMRISSYLPSLSCLYTRAIWLPMIPNILPPLTCLTADFDFIDYGQIVIPFLLHSGASLRKLTLIDQIYRLDVSQIAECCPNLEDLTAKVTVEDESKSVPLQNLQVAKVRITDPSTFSWIMRNSPNIQRFECLFEWEDEEIYFENTVITRLANDRPKSLESIRHLSIHLFYGPTYNVLQGTLTIEAALTLCEACDNLRILGELHTWKRVTSEDVELLSDYIKEHNWDVKISFRDIFYPLV